MEQRAVYQAGSGILTQELVRQLEEKLTTLLNGMTGYGEITIVVEARKVKWVRITESEPVLHTPFE